MLKGASPKEGGYFQRPAFVPLSNLRDSIWDVALPDPSLELQGPGGGGALKNVLEKCKLGPGAKRPVPSADFSVKSTQQPGGGGEERGAPLLNPSRGPLIACGGRKLSAQNTLLATPHLGLLILPSGIM